MRYDPEHAPDADVWRDLDEDEAEASVRRYHRSPRCDHSRAPNPRLHDLTHVIVENQAALADETPVAAALARLVGEGLTRHDAVHAVGSVLAGVIFEALRHPDDAPREMDLYYDKVEALTAESWRRETALAEVDTAFSAHSDEELIELLFTEEDRLPRAAVDEILARCPRLTHTLIAILIDPRNWDVPLPEWWAPMHATFILGAVPDAACDAALLSAMRDAEALDNDWICLAMPAILGARGARLRPILVDIIRNTTEPEEVRCTALDGLAATTLVDREGRDEVFALIGEVFTDPQEDLWVRTHAAQLLLDFQERAYAEALTAFARDVLEPECDPFAGIAFDTDDVARAFAEDADLSRYRDSWLDFYDAELIADRQRRWAEEAAEEAEAAHARIKVGRNEPCPCGSGRKYKKCCLPA